MPVSTPLEELQSRVIGVVPAEGREGAGFIVYEGDSRTGRFEEFLPSRVVILAYANAREALRRAPHPLAGRGTVVWESSFNIDPGNPFEKLPDLVADIEKGLAAVKTSQEKAPRAVLYCDGRLPLPDILAFLHGLKSEKGTAVAPGKACKACGQGRKDSDWVCPHCGDANWLTIAGAGLGGAALIAYGGFVVAEGFLTGKVRTGEQIGIVLGVSVVGLIISAFFLRLSWREFKSARAWKTRRGAMKRHPNAQ